MKKSAAVKFFGGYAHAAVAMGVSESTVRRWPDELPDRIEAEVIGVVAIKYGTYVLRRDFRDVIHRASN